jgi:quercetin dioxygenase-like cupin family protein
MEVNDEVVEAGAYVHFPPNEVMRHAPAGEESCLFLILFHGRFDVDPVEE